MSGLTAKERCVPSIEASVRLPAIRRCPISRRFLSSKKIVGFTNVGIAVTPNGAMSPASSVSGLMIAHPESRYFMIGAIAPDQRRDYAARRGITEEELSKWLPK